MKTFCLAIDLINDETSIYEYEQYHKNVWPEVIQSIRQTGIIDMKIYRVFNRLSMVLETNDDFSFDQKRQMDMENPIVIKWETLMQKYQQSLPGIAAGEKWKLMNLIFDLT